MNDFVFNYILNEIKDKTFSNTRQFRLYLLKKYKIDDTYRQDITRLWIAINKYQIKKYGRSINPSLYIDLSKETLYRKAQIRKAVMYERTHGKSR